MANRKRKRGRSLAFRLKMQGHSQEIVCQVSEFIEAVSLNRVTRPLRDSHLGVVHPRFRVWVDGQTNAVRFQVKHPEASYQLTAVARLWKKILNLTYHPGKKIIESACLQPIVKQRRPRRSKRRKSG